MKAASLHTLKRFFSLLVTNRDIVESTNRNQETEIVHRADDVPMYTPLEISSPLQTPKESIRIQPEEIGELEYIDTYAYSETGVLTESEDFIPHEIFQESLQGNSPDVTPEISDTLPHIQSETPEDIFYDYALSDIPESILKERPTENLVRKNKKFMSLRDVLVERGNFWEEKSKKSKNIWERNIEMPEEEMVIDHNTLVGDVIFEEKNDSEEEGEIVGNHLGESPMLLGFSEDHGDTITLDQNSFRRHTLLVGQTGSGKSTLMERMILQDIDAGRGVGLIDPHGDLYDRIIHRIPKSRSNDVVLFDLADIDYPIGFNILENTHEQFSSLVASSIVGVFKKIFGYSWGPRLEYILRNATLTLLEKPGTTLLDLTMLLTDEEFRKRYLAQIKNPFLQKFWTTEFENMSQMRQAEVVGPILNKVGQFLSVPLIRNIVSQPQSGFSPRWVMDNKKIFLANLSKGKIGEDVSDMFGSMLVSKFQLDVMSRATIEPENRVPFRLYVDEFQNFATESFADIFSEARKYGLELIIAHQYLGQVDKKLVEAILGNVGNIIVFHTSHDDAKILAPNMSKTLDIPVLTEQQNFSFIVKTVKDKKKSVQSGELIPMDMVVARDGLQDSQKLQTLVREKFAKKREFVEGKLSNKME
ncbi:MAG: type IV secretion system DNA-binding domain-containing protein [Candidatus Gracilibacteria bacterium]